MRKLFVVSGLLLFAGSAFSQGMGQRRSFYDPSKVVTISGSIQAVDTVTGRRGNFHMIQLEVKDSTGTTRVMVGPSTYLDQEKVSFSVGDAVQVTGAKMEFNGNEIMIAGQIVDGGKTIKLRDESGRPVWARGGGQ